MGRYHRIPKCAWSISRGLEKALTQASQGYMEHSYRFSLCLKIKEIFAPAGQVCMSLISLFSPNISSESCTSFNTKAVTSQTEELSLLMSTEWCFCKNETGKVCVFHRRPYVIVNLFMYSSAFTPKGFLLLWHL